MLISQTPAVRMMDARQSGRRVPGGLVVWMVEVKWRYETPRGDQRVTGGPDVYPGIATGWGSLKSLSSQAN